MSRRIGRQSPAPRSQDERQQHPVPEARVECRRPRGGQASVDDARFTGIEPRNDLSVRVDDRGNARIRGSNDRKAFLYGAYPCGSQMLLGSDAGAEPGVVRRVENPVRSEQVVDHMAWEDDLIADQHDCRWQAREVKDLGRGARMKIKPAGSQFREAKQPAKRQIPTASY